MIRLVYTFNIKGPVERKKSVLFLVLISVFSCGGPAWSQDSFPVGPEIPFLQGVINDCDGPFQSQDVIVNNCWQGFQNNIETVVYGGAQASNLQQGMIVILTIPDYPAKTTSHRILTPVQAGSVHIQAAQGGVLLLGLESGSYVLTFDLGSSQFISNAVVPVAVVPSTEVAVTASGLAYSRAGQTYNGTVTVKNISARLIPVPLQVVFSGLTPNATLVNATDTFSGNPFITIPLVTNLASGQSVTINVQFQNSSNTAIHFEPIIYTGSLN